MNDKENPNISVIIPTYNRANLLGKSIQSVLNQTYKDFEVIIVDDGSTDNTQEVVKSFEDARIKYISHKKNEGVAKALNSGIDNSKGNFISFLGSDDEFLPAKLEKELKVFELSDSKVGVVYSGVLQQYDDKKTYTLPSSVRQGNIRNELLKGNFVHGLSLIRRSCFQKVGTFDGELNALEDWELYIRISEFYEFKFNDEPLLITPLTNDSLSVNHIFQINAMKRIIKKHYDLFNEEKESIATIYGFIGSHLCLNEQSNESRAYFLKAIQKNPANIRYYSAFFVSFLGSKGYKKFLELHRSTYN